MVFFSSHLIHTIVLGENLGNLVSKPCNRDYRVGFATNRKNCLMGWEKGRNINLKCYLMPMDSHPKFGYFFFFILGPFAEGAKIMFCCST